MTYEPVLGIDLGASYTKVSIRDEIVQPNAKTYYTKLVGRMPTLGIRDSGRSKDIWYFGDQAAGLTPGAKTKSYENWKAQLSLKTTGTENAEAVIVGYHFFVWLRAWLKHNNINPDAQRVRVCVPALENVEPYASTIAQIMDKAGWREDVQIIKVSEPRANAIGIMSRGCNIVLRTGSPHYGQMSLYGNLAYRHIINQRPPNAKICILDVGSFTTDIAGVTLDLGGQVSGSTTLFKSWRHGIINELDQVVLPELCSSYDIDWSRRQFTEREMMKRKLYAGGQHAIGSVILGGEKTDRVLIDSALDRFCSELWTKVKSEVNTFNPEFCFLTGGGCQIPIVRDELAARFKSLKCTVIPVPKADPKSTIESAETVATALGAASVILDAEEPELSLATGIRSHPINSADIPCPCSGGNKECCRCSGSGYYRKTKGL